MGGSAKFWVGVCHLQFQLYPVDVFLTASVNFQNLITLTVGQILILPSSFPFYPPQGQPKCIQ